MSTVKWLRPKVLAGLFMLLSWPMVGWGLDSDDLWLPASYRKLAPELRQAALKVEATDRCHKLLRGGLHDSTDGIDNAVFLLVCRDSTRKTYSILADANSLELSFLVVEPVAEEEDPDELLRERVEALRSECGALYTQKTRFMKGLKALTDEPAPAQVDAEGGVTLVIDFDAQSLQGKPLRYRANCYSASEESAAKLTIRARQGGGA